MPRTDALISQIIDQILPLNGIHTESMIRLWRHDEVTQALEQRRLSFSDPPRVTTLWAHQPAKRLAAEIATRGRRRACRVQVLTRTADTMAWWGTVGKERGARDINGRIDDGLRADPVKVVWRVAMGARTIVCIVVLGRCEFRGSRARSGDL